MDQVLYTNYLNILKEELVCATGCTEPIAVAYAGALAKKTLGQLPERVELIVSGSIIKNVKSVIVPNTCGRKGLEAAVLAGIACGDADRELEVLSGLNESDMKRLQEALDTIPVEVRESKDNIALDIQVRVFAGNDTAYVRIVHYHTNVVRIEKNNSFLLYREISEPEAGSVSSTKKDVNDCSDASEAWAAAAESNRSDRTLLSVEKIVEFADEVDVADVKELLDQQINANMTIAQKGLNEEYGAQIGRILLRSYGNSVHNRAKAWAAAGSDARMDGCELPVVINSGSGNQGITTSVPVIVYGRELGVSDDTLYRALVVSNLITIHLKTGIGSLSAYCGATSAGAGAGAGICYLYGGKYSEIAHTVVNALAINSGMICDGAKPSCAAKIASAVEAGLLGWQMNAHASEFRGGDGIIIKGVENTIRSVSRLATEGMQSTNREIIEIMLGNDRK